MRILLKTKNKTIFIPYETCSIEIYDGETYINHNTWEKVPDYYLIRIICNNNLYVIPYKFKKYEVAFILINDIMEYYNRDEHVFIFDNWLDKMLENFNIEVEKLEESNI